VNAGFLQRVFLDARARLRSRAIGLVARVNPVFGAAIYSYRLTANTPGAVPVVKQDTASNYTFTDLISGVKYTIEVNAAGTAGASDWSNPASLTAD